jgi:predicted nucleic acid-binding protein
MIIADTSVWVSYLHDFTHPAALKLKAAIVSTEVALGDLVLMEILRGARDDLHARQLEQSLSRFPILQVLDTHIARKSAENYRRLRSLGITVRKVPDVVLATFCTERGHSLLHQDRDFLHFEEHFGLKVLH